MQKKAQKHPPKSSKAKTLDWVLTTLAGDPHPVICIHTDGTVIYANQIGQKIMQEWQEKFDGLPSKLRDACLFVQKKGEIIRREFQIDHKIYLCTLIWIPKFSQINIYALEITELKLTQRKMLDLANYDHLTHLANRQYFESTLKDWMLQATESNEPFGVMLIDLDNFKSVNDTLGHQVGDRLLQTVTRRMAGCLRRSDFIARLGGDEFVVLLKVIDYFHIEMIAEKINDVLAATFELGDYHVQISCSIGICFSFEQASASELLRNADIAMYQAKKQGKNHYIVFSNSKHNTQYKRHRTIRKDLKKAETVKQFYIDYQPQFDLNSLKIIGFEAFIRWHHPQYGLISPNEFIPLAEQTGCLLSIGNWIVQQVLSDYKNKIAPLSQTSISFNLALAQLNEQDFIHHLCENLERSNIDKGTIILDIPEKISFTQYRHLEQNLKVIHSKGIKLSLDNFGSFDSSLNRLLEFPFNFVKIDQSFLHTIEQHPQNKAFISGIIELGNKLGLQIIQKGVENEEQCNLLKELGCPFAQGFYLCRPLSADNLRLFLIEHNQSSG